MTRYLDVYFKNTKAGILGQDTDGTLTFGYDTEYVQNINPRCSIFCDVVSSPQTPLR